MLFILGDFAVLLQAGLTVRKALFYNVLSSALSLFGTMLGLLISNFGDATQWVYAITAGCFIYIALSNLVRYFSAFILSIKFIAFLHTWHSVKVINRVCESSSSIRHVSYVILPHLPLDCMVNSASQSIAPKTINANRLSVLILEMSWLVLPVSAQ